MKYERGDIEWDRSLDEDLDTLKAWGAVALLTLIQPHEFRKLGVPDLGDKARARMRWHWIPVPDGGVPDQAGCAAWLNVRSELVGELISGRRVALHCHAGLGRAGTMVASLLNEFGVTAADAIDAVRRARPGAIQSIEQEQFIGRMQAAEDG